MYCPKCSQQQPAEGMRFCSRCGFTLTGVALLLDNNGVIAQVAAAPYRVPTPRNRILLESGILTMFTWALALIAMFWFDAHGPFETAARITSLLFFVLGLISLLRFLYGFLFAKDVIRPAAGALDREPLPRSLRREPTQAVLPPEHSLPLSDYPLRVNTREILRQPSVTEHTTGLLDEQSNE